MNQNQFNTTNKQHGLTLIEMMVALVLSLIIMGGVIQIFISNKATYRMNEAMSRVQENGRFAAMFLAQDIRSAGYYGCSSASTPVNHVDNTSGSYDYGGPAIEGTDGAAGAPDTVIIRGAYSSGISLTASMPLVSSALQIAIGNGLSKSDIIMISDCTASDVMQISGPNDDTPDITGTINHNTGNAVSPGNLTQPLSQAYSTDATIYLMKEYTFSIQTGSTGEPALFRSENGGAAIELVEGVENMQILYGEDTDATADSVANRYRTATNVADWNKVVSVRITLLLRTIDDNVASEIIDYNYNGTTDITPTDKRLRRVFTTTIGIRNRIL